MIKAVQLDPKVLISITMAPSTESSGDGGSEESSMTEPADTVEQTRREAERAGDGEDEWKKREGKRKEYIISTSLMYHLCKKSKGSKHSLRRKRCLCLFGGAAQQTTRYRQGSFQEAPSASTAAPRAPPNAWQSACTVLLAGRWGSSSHLCHARIAQTSGEAAAYPERLSRWMILDDGGLTLKCTQRCGALSGGGVEDPRGALQGSGGTGCRKQAHACSTERVPAAQGGGAGRRVQGVAGRRASERARARSTERAQAVRRAAMQGGGAGHRCGALQGGGHPRTLNGACAGGARQCRGGQRRRDSKTSPRGERGALQGGGFETRPKGVAGRRRHGGVENEPTHAQQSVRGRRKASVQGGGAGRRRGALQGGGHRERARARSTERAQAVQGGGVGQGSGGRTAAVSGTGPRGALQGGGGTGASKTSPRTLNGACASGARHRCRAAVQGVGAGRRASKTSPHTLNGACAVQGGGLEHGSVRGRRYKYGRRTVYKKLALKYGNIDNDAPKESQLVGVAGEGAYAQNGGIGRPGVGHGPLSRSPSKKTSKSSGAELASITDPTESDARTARRPARERASARNPALR
ncbi:hypothetical protein GGX14DRAFT_397077 [Mycena pura]|uniref:Uncharacterized protein n=1 Tax=Mycena pura TaxID=153505 RepID=A0AAD6YEV9_9AGAR|nr:hypothetical protein GGX14DRAFT_397077 [Mycena pura]